MHAYRNLWQDDSFRPVWLTGMMVGVFRWLELLAVGVFTFQVSGSATLVSLTTLLRMAPLFLFGLPMGMLADRFDRKTLLLIGLATLAASSSTLTLLAATDRLTLWHVGLSAFLNGSFWAAEFSVRRAMLGEIAGNARLGPAMALESSTSNATRMLGPALGGVILASAGLTGVFAAAGIAYFLSFLLIRPVVYEAQAPKGPAGLLDTLIEGWRTVRSSRIILASLAVTMVVNFWGFAYITLIPVIGELQLGLSAVSIGFFASTEGLGALVGSLLVGLHARPAHYTRIYLYASLCFLFTVVGISLSSVVPLSFALMFMAGMFIAGFAVMQATVTFLAAPPETRSRVMGVLTVSIGTCPIGMLHVGLLADYLGAGSAVMVMAIEGLIALALVALLWPELRRETLLTPA
ncbi:MAG: MFS transporter [Alphaproteobacteria bacterium]